MDTVEAGCRQGLIDLRTALSNPGDLRDVFVALFPEGLVLFPDVAPDDRPRRPSKRGRRVRSPCRDPSPEKSENLARQGRGLTVRSLCVATPTGFEPVSPA